MTINASFAVLKQLHGLLSQLTTDEYTQKLPVLNGSSIGQHVRHTVEFFQCLFEGFSTGIINYDARKRNLLIETNLGYTLQLIGEISHLINNTSEGHLPIQLKVNFDDENFEIIETNFMRELVYMVEHSIHHFALIRVGIQVNFKHIQIDSDFGVAYSTIRHQQELSVSH
ncbi:DinB family protein [Runella sp. SP2]|uniref:DinB family protein n=1 Tax=Runella sp. SP2 TaxID=2268026 RepID=UPI000F07ECB5|nr:DinB family protein [Runella sp. SP2]AYQ31823.1 DinB family protein [Runella sp. SP2]